MRINRTDRNHGTGELRIFFPMPAPSSGMKLEPEQKITFNGVTATLRATADGELEIRDPAFIRELATLGFRLGRNDSPERVKEILRSIPEQYRETFMDGFNAKRSSP